MGSGPSPERQELPGPDQAAIGESIISDTILRAWEISQARIFAGTHDDLFKDLPCVIIGVVDRGSKGVRNYMNLF